MQPDLRQLTIEKGELRRLSGVSPSSLVRPPTRRRFFAETVRTALTIVLLAMSALILSLGFPLHMPFLVMLHGAIALFLAFEDWRKFRLTHKSRILIALLKDTEKFNAAIKAIDINDQLKRAGNPSAKLQQRDQVIAALKLAREDLVRALKTERILRENAGFIRLNADLFANNLDALAAMQVSMRADEYSRLLDEALQISLGVQAEMRKLQGQRLN